MGEFVQVETDGSVATIRLDRPPANALARPVSEELWRPPMPWPRTTASAPSSCGAGSHFAAGADIKAMVGYGPRRSRPDVGALEAGLPRRSRRSRSP